MITYADKEAFKVRPGIVDTQKVTAANMNEIKSVVNAGINSTAKVSLDATQLAALNIIPVDLVTAQGANTIIEISRCLVVYNYGTQPYNAESINLRYSTNPLLTATLVSSPIMSATESRYQPLSISFFSPLTDITNDGLELIASGDLGATGDGTLDLYITYRVITLT